jgi:hypothetical protein
MEEIQVRISDIATPVIESLDLAQELGPAGVREILELMWIAFHDMISDNVNVSNYSENRITEQWYIRLNSRWYRENRALRLTCRLDPILQHEDMTFAANVGQPPTIDFCFRTWDPDDRYFGVECKNLRITDSSSIRRYVDTGINNYTSGRYGSSSTVSALVGYILSGTVENIIIALNEAINNTIQNLNRDLSYDDPHYYSAHIRTLDNVDITLHHLMFTFAA